MKSEYRHSDLKITQEEFDNSSTQKQILDVSANWEVPATRTTEEIHKKLMQRIEAGEKYRIAVKRKNYYWEVAAAILIFLGLFFLFQSPERTITTRAAENTQLELPDGSSVHLNAKSELVYNKKEFADDRTLYLRGEAFFEVQKGSRFLINTDIGTVEVLGTSLNVLARSNQFSVACLTGKVKVSSGDQSVVIFPGEKTELRDQILVKHIGQNTKQMASWRKGIFYFEDQPLIYIFDEIERQYKVKIDAKSIGKRFYTGAFTNKNLIETLETVCVPMNLKYDIQKGNKIIIAEKKQ